MNKIVFTHTIKVLDYKIYIEMLEYSGLGWVSLWVDGVRGLSRRLGALQRHCERQAGIKGNCRTLLDVGDTMETWRLCDKLGDTEGD